MSCVPAFRPTLEDESSEGWGSTALTPSGYVVTSPYLILPRRRARLAGLPV
jgi:hypothetical protein